MAASVNIGMFNLGNAIGAWVGGATISAEFGLASPNWAGAILSLIALGLAFVAWTNTRRVHRGKTQISEQSSLRHMRKRSQVPDVYR